MRRKRKTLKHYFVPGAHNGFRPLFLRLEAVAVNAAIIVLLFLIALGVENLVVRNPSPQIGAVIASVLVDLANSDRSSEGYPALAVNETLQKAAQMKADDMADKEYFAHDSPEGFDPWHWFKQAGYDFRFAGENLAVYFSDSAEVEDAWMNSPLHRANILGEHFTEVGIALSQGSYQGRETTFVVQMFGLPAKSSVEASAATVVESQKVESNPPAIVAGASASAEGGSSFGGEVLAKPGAISSRPPSNTFWRVLTAPKTVLQYIYMGLAALVLLALGLLFYELCLPRPKRRGRLHIRASALSTSSLDARSHIPSMIYGIGLLALMGILLYGGTLFSGQLLIL